MDAADDLELRWLHLDAQAGSSSNPGGSAGLDRHALSNSVTAILGAARLLCDRWDELGEPERRELAAMVLRRAEDLRRTLGGGPSSDVAGTEDPGS